MKSGERRAALLLGAVVSVNASYTLLIPFVPDLRDRAGAGPTVIALTFALFAGAKAACQPVGGMWVDRWAPNKVSCLSLLIAATGIVITALARDPVTLLAGRTCWGVGEGLVTPALYAGMSLLCRHYGLSTSRMMGSFGTAAVAGFLLGPVIAVAATAVGLDALFLICAGATVVTAIGILRTVPDSDSPPAENPVTDAPMPAGFAASRWWIWVLIFGALDMFTNLSYSALEPVLPLYLSAANGSTARTAISLVFAVGLAVFGLVSWLLGRFAERLRLLALVRIGLVFAAAGVAGLAGSADVRPVVVCFSVVMVGQAVLYLTARRGIAELGSAMARQGRAFGLFGLASDVGNIIGPIAGVVLYGLTGRLSFLLLGTLSVLVLAALTIAAGGRGRHVEHDPGELVPSAGDSA
ncbi:MAG TPA: MFS transporter [Pseudonocardiaceae bacterium]